MTEKTQRNKIPEIKTLMFFEYSNITKMHKMFI